MAGENGTGAGFSGKSGSVTFGDTPADVVEVTKWTLDRTVSIGSYASNKTDGHKKKVAGVADTKGTIEIKVSNPASTPEGQQLHPGDAVQLDLHADDSESNYFQCLEAVIVGSPIEVDIDGGEVVGLTYNFEASDCVGYGIFAAS